MNADETCSRKPYGALRSGLALISGTADDPVSVCWYFFALADSCETDEREARKQNENLAFRWAKWQPKRLRTPDSLSCRPGAVSSSLQAI